MYLQFLIEDKSTEILVRHVMEKIRMCYPDREVFYDCKSFKGIGHLKKGGSIQEQKTGQLLNDLSMYLKAFDRSLAKMNKAAVIVVLDNDMRNVEDFKNQLEALADEVMKYTDRAFCIAVKEMEAWLLGDAEAMEKAYPNIKKSALKTYVQDELCDTWEVLANALYPGGIAALRKKAGTTYSEVGRVKAEWADKIGSAMDLRKNLSPSFNNFILQLQTRIELV